MLVNKIEFPVFSGKRCLMMPYIQGDPESVPIEYRSGYEDIIENNYLELGMIGFLTIDESLALKGKPHRGDRSMFGRALHTEAGKINKLYAWGGGSGYGWGRIHNVTLDESTRVLLANNLDGSCAVWDAWHENTSLDGDIGNFSNEYPMSDALIMKAGDVCEIGILTPHESLPVSSDVNRQFIRIIGQGVSGRETYFTENRLMKH